MAYDFDEFKKKFNEKLMDYGQMTTAAPSQAAATPPVATPPVAAKPESTGMDGDLVMALMPALTSLAGYAVGGLGGGAAGGQSGQESYKQLLTMKTAEKDKAEKAKQQQFQDLMLAANLGLKTKELGLKEESTAADVAKKQSDIKQAERKMTSPVTAQELTPAQKKVDEVFAREYQDWTAQGGFAGVEKQLNQLEDASNIIKKKPDLVGGMISKIPYATDDAVLARTNPELLALKQQIHQAIQSTLRATLGPQFTQTEAFALLNRAFDPRLSAADNQKKLKSAIDELRQRAEAKNKAALFYEKNGTLRGFSPTQMRVMGQGSEPAAISPQDQQAMDFVKANPKDERAAAIIERLKGKGVWQQ